jgi:hypothetical protein
MQALTIKREDDRKTIPVGSYGVEVRVKRDGFGGAMLHLERRGMGCPTVVFKLNPDLVQALELAIKDWQRVKAA